LPEQWQPEVLEDGLARYLNMSVNVKGLLAEQDSDSEVVALKVREFAAAAWDAKVAEFPADIFANIQKMVLLQNLDRLWRGHLQALDYLRKGINLRGFAQKDPINEFARESFMLFEDLLRDIKQDTTALLSRVRLVVEEQPAAPMAPPVAEKATKPASTKAVQKTKKPAPKNNKTVTKATLKTKKKAK
jgi:preprotein translocase subunit SecA